MQVGFDQFPPIYELDDHFKNEKRAADKQIPDETFIEKAEHCAKAKKGGEAAAFVRAVKDPAKREAITQKIFAIFAGFDQSAAETYDAAKGFIWGITSIPPKKPE